MLRTHLDVLLWFLLAENLPPKRLNRCGSAEVPFLRPPTKLSSKRNLAFFRNNWKRNNYTRSYYLDIYEKKCNLFFFSLLFKWVFWTGTKWSWYTCFFFQNTAIFVASPKLIKHTQILQRIYIIINVRYTILDTKFFLKNWELYDACSWIKIIILS